MGRYLEQRLDPDGVERQEERALEREERAAHHARFLCVAEDGIGGVRVTGRGTVEDAAVITSVLAPMAAPQPAAAPGSCGGAPGRGVACGVTDCAHDGRDPREHGARLWDALVEACRLLSGVEVLPTDHGARPRVGVTISLADLTDDLARGDVDGRDAEGRVPGEVRLESNALALTGLGLDGLGLDGLGHGPEVHTVTRGVGRLDTGGQLSAATVRRLACDADILPLVLGTRSQVLDVGRTRRLVTLGIWRALVVRDRHCAFPGCTRPPICCDAHHIRHWADGGGTSLDNLVMLCRTHHTVIHSTPWQVRLNRDDRRPDFLPQSRLDPEQRPLRRRPLRQ